MSRQQVVDAAMTTVQHGDFDQLTIRGLAANLGVAPMTIYRHIRDKDDLLDEVVDRLLAAVWEPTAARNDWVAWITEAADRLRQLLVEQPAALHVYLRHPVISPAAVHRMETVLDVLRGSGASETNAHRAYASIHTYTVGFAALEASRATYAAPSDQASDLDRELAAHTTPQQFLHGLAYLLEGIHHRTGTPKRHPAERPKTNSSTKPNPRSTSPATALKAGRNQQTHPDDHNPLPERPLGQND